MRPKTAKKLEKDQLFVFINRAVYMLYYLRAQHPILKGATFPFYGPLMRALSKKLASHLVRLIAWQPVFPRNTGVP